jgi:hypothetical protein
MNYSTIKKLQKEFGFDGIQSLINTGDIWKMEGSMGRYAMELLTTGACMLPKKAYRDFYGNRVPSRDELVNGSKGTYNNSVRFYETHITF